MATTAQFLDKAAHEVEHKSSGAMWCTRSGGMGNRTPSGRRVKALFSGASGTSKTTTAAVLARKLTVSLYQIHAFGVVNKYIAETDKNQEYDGIAILTSNLSNNNIDAAFAHRTMPWGFRLADEDLRLRFWKGISPPGDPLSPDVDLEFLARQFRIAGGDIHNVVQAAAFLAADNSRVLPMELLTMAMAWQRMKQERVPSSTEFEQYYPSVAQREA